jgi:hypothetical protein
LSTIINFSRGVINFQTFQHCYSAVMLDQSDTVICHWGVLYVGGDFIVVYVVVFLLESIFDNGFCNELSASDSRCSGGLRL